MEEGKEEEEATQIILRGCRKYKKERGARVTVV